LTRNRERDKQRLDASIAFIERQLEELYGPIAVLLLASRQTFRDLLESLHRNHVFENAEPLPEEELRAWLFWAENDAFPRDQKIAELLMQKTHLIEGEWFPDSYVKFLDHHNSWTLSHLRWKKESIPYSWHSSKEWPQEFVVEILDTFQNLKRRHGEYTKLQQPLKRVILLDTESRRTIPANKDAYTR